MAEQNVKSKGILARDIAAAVLVVSMFPAGFYLVNKDTEIKAVDGQDALIALGAKKANLEFPEALKKAALGVYSNVPVKIDGADHKCLVQVNLPRYRYTNNTVEFINCKPS